MLIAIGVLVAARLCRVGHCGRKGTNLVVSLQLLGACLLTAVVLAHVAETFELFPSMGWGRSETMGHYIDLVSALGGSVLLPTGYIGDRVRAKRC